MRPSVADDNSIGKQFPTVNLPTSWAQAGIFIVLVLGLYFPVLIELVGDWWSDPNSSHGFFIPVFSAYVVWTNRKQLAVLPAEPSWSGLLIIPVALCALTVGVLGAELFLSCCSFVIIIAGFLVYFRGRRFFRAVLFPWACLFLMIPIPTLLLSQVTFPLQLIASRFAQTILVACGIPVLRDGNILLLPSMSLEVAQACSGIRLLTALLALAIIFGYFREPSMARRVALAVAAIPIAIADNGLRIVLTGLLVQRWGPAMAERFLHSIEGLLMISMAMVMLLFTHTLICFLVARPNGKAS